MATGRLAGAQVVGDGTAPDIAELAACLRFSIREGRIWFDTHRVVLIHLSTLAALRQEIINRMGATDARGLLTRMGYASGARDAALARKLRPHHSAADAFLVGPQLRRLQGVAPLDPVRLEIDIAAGHFYGEFRWNDSFEVVAHEAAAGGLSSVPVCWMQTGYASGYASTFIGRTIVFKEVACSAMGAADCRIIGKPLEAWDDIEDDVKALQAETFANRFPGRIRSTQTICSSPARGACAHEDLVGVSPGFIAASHLVERVARTEATVLFLGETGVGKEIFARTLHRISRRGDRPFVAINCAAIPDNLIEAELFGVEKGAYTGAVESRQGRFERANGGTLFLDEVASLTPSAQVKLLRALQEKEIERVGGVRSVRVNVRIVAATNVDLKAAVEARSFRDDLMFRLNVFPIRIPPLRERRDDIPLLMDHFQHRFATRHGKTVTGFTERAVDALYAYHYPGNIRELENMIERAVILCEDGGPLDIGHFQFVDGTPTMLHLDRAGKLDTASPSEATTSNMLDLVLATGMPLEEVETAVLTAAVSRAQGNLSKAARLLGLTRPQLAYRLKRRAGVG